MVSAKTKDGADLVPGMIVYHINWPVGWDENSECRLTVREYWYVTSSNNRVQVLMAKPQHDLSPCLQSDGTPYSVVAKECYSSVLELSKGIL